ncbi:hypothetical protein [Micromonospora cathayae]|uniref:Uncharacterized protein n=1 Tax=Micromonospora cathayae TaxID=3028804 RepID=A0ABY7ZS19_9ACTN|nr:hypothetical protein [Micromonospora sp. HUAS 3]WDZ85695.1 hypothetical protein PVK37_04390 [Micromonospora sp. HUAS 3]
MPAPVLPDDKRGLPRLPLLFWVGVALAVIAALLLLVADGNGTLRVAAVLALGSVVAIGLSVALRPDDGAAVRQLYDEVDELRAEIAVVARSGHQVAEQAYRAPEAVASVPRRTGGSASVPGAEPVPGGAGAGPLSGTGRTTPRSGTERTASMSGPEHAGSVSGPEGAGPVPGAERAGPGRARVAVPGAAGAVSGRTDEPEPYRAVGPGGGRGWPEESADSATDEPTGGRRRTDETAAGRRRTDEAAAGRRRTDEAAAGRRRSTAAEGGRRRRPEPDEDRDDDARRPDEEEPDRYRARRRHEDEPDPYARRHHDDEPDRYRARRAQDQWDGYRSDDYPGQRPDDYPGHRSDDEEPAARRTRPAARYAAERPAPGVYGVPRPDGPGAGHGPETSRPVGVVRHTETVHVTTRHTIVDGSGPDPVPGNVYGRWTPTPPPEEQPWSGPADDRWDGPAPRQERPRSGRSRESADRGWEGPDDRGWERPDDRAWEGPAERSDRDRPYPAEGAGADHWSDVRAGDRWAAVRDDEHGREVRMGERRAALHADGAGTELRMEDRWATVRRGEPRREHPDPRREHPGSRREHPDPRRAYPDPGPEPPDARRAYPDPGAGPRSGGYPDRGGRWPEPHHALPPGGVPVPDAFRAPRQRPPADDWPTPDTPRRGRAPETGPDGYDRPPREYGSRSAPDHWQ